MRLSNRNKHSFYSFTNSFIYSLLLVGIILYIANAKRFQIFDGHYSVFLIVVPILIIIIHQRRGRQIFEYDSDGEALNFKNRHVIPAFSRVSNDEFPKYKLVKFDIVNFIILKRLYIVVDSKKSKNTTLVYEISYLNKKEIQDLRTSLRKVVKNNQENKTSIQ